MKVSAYILRYSNGVCKLPSTCGIINTESSAGLIQRRTDNTGL